MASKVGLFLLALVLFSVQAHAIVIDDFESGNSSNWTVRCGEWTIVSPGNNSNFALQSSGVNCCGVAADKRIDYNFFIGSYGRYSYDVFFPATGFIDDGGFYIQEAGNCNFLALRLAAVPADNLQDEVYLAQGGTASILTCTPVHLSRGVWHTVTIERYPNGVFRVYTDGNLKMEGFSLSPQYAGKIALQGHSTGVIWDNITFDPNLPPDPSIPTPSSCSATGMQQCDLNLGCGPVCPANGDINGDGSLSPSDVVLMLNCTFLGAPGCICPAP